MVGADVPEAELAVGGVVDGAAMDGLAGLGGEGSRNDEEEEGCEGWVDSHGGYLLSGIGKRIAARWAVGSDAGKQTLGLKPDSIVGNETRG